jgi:hypothetical protein
VVDLPRADALPDGTYYWFMLVVNETNGSIWDIVTTVIASPGVAPIITAIDPSSPPVVNGNQNVDVLGSNFQANLMVDVFNSGGVKIGTLSGTQILNVTPSSFTMVVNLGNGPGTFGVEVINPDGKRSSRWTFSTR